MRAEEAGRGRLGLSNTPQAVEGLRGYIPEGYLVR